MKTQTKIAALKAKKSMINEGIDAHIYKFAGKRKWQYFIGTYWQWMIQIS